METLEKEIFIGNIEYLYPELSSWNSLRIAVGALTLTNQKSMNDGCHPMICGWNENPAVGFAEFQWWLGCRIEESHFIIGEKVIPFKENLLLTPEIMKGELSIVLIFEDFTQFRLTVRDKTKPIEVCVREGSDFIRKKIKEYGYTDLSGD